MGLLLRRAGPGAGILFVVLSVVGGFIYPQQPRVDSTPAHTLAWVHGHRVALQAGMVLAIFAAGALVWFAGHLRLVFGDPVGSVVLGAGVAVAVTTTVAALPTTILAFMDDQPAGITDPSLIRMLGDLNTICFAITSVMTSVFLLAIGVANLGERALPPWLGRLALAFSAWNAVGVWIGVTFSTYHGKGWMAVGWGAYVAFLVFVLAACTVLLRATSAAGVSARPTGGAERSGPLQSASP